MKAELQVTPASLKWQSNLEEYVPLSRDCFAKFTRGLAMTASLEQSLLC